MIRSIRVFEEPLLPIGGDPTPEETAALKAALERYHQQGQTEAVAPLEDFLRAYPRSPWKASLLTELGITYRRCGYFSRALDAWEEAWSLSKQATDLPSRAIADRAACELLELNCRLGRMDRIRGLRTELDQRQLVGPASERVSKLRQALWLMEQRPGDAFRCGPMALASIARATGKPPAICASFDADHSTQQGTTLLQNLRWSDAAGLGLQMAKRAPGAAVLAPALVHWKAGHFAALLKEDHGLYQLQDPTFGGDIWVSRAALDEEASGYTLVAKGLLPKGWSAVSEREGEAVRGRGSADQSPQGGPDQDPDNDSCPANGGGGGGPEGGMPVYGLMKPYIAEGFKDMPLSYTPPRGYPVRFELVYTQQDTYQPQTFTYGNVGPVWSFSWVQYITDDPSKTPSQQNVTRYNRYGGQATYAGSGYNSGTKAYAVDFHNYGQLSVPTSSTYTFTLPDGSTETYGHSDGATTYPRRIFMTQKTDPAGNTLTFAYDSQNRLTSVTDALGQVTTLSYGLSGDPLKVTLVTDPFSRTATLTYNSSGQLASITDAMGMTSSFSYGLDSASPAPPSGAPLNFTTNFINAMTTPYGTTTFAMASTNSGSGTFHQWVQATDPLGNQERVEFLQSAPGISPHVQQPSGFTDLYMDQRNVFYWDKRAMAQGAGDYTKAEIFHYLHQYPASSLIMSDVLEARKRPLEGWVWNWYPGQTYSYETGSMSSPSETGRFLDDGSFQATSYQYNSLGKPTQVTDPAGRITSYVYSSSGVDLLEVHNITGGQDDLLAQYTYNSQHRPLTVKDASGQTTTFTYNSFGQVATVTNALSQTTTLSYDSSGYLQSITSPTVSSAYASTAFTYDSVGRVYTVTQQPDSYVLTYAYDNLDRRTQTTYPDSTTDQTFYDRMDVGTTKDRLGRWTVYDHNALRQLVAVQDAQGRVTTLDWCGCGSLDGLVDPVGNATNWSRDLQSRVIAKIYPDSSQVTYGYDGAGRLQQRQDALGQITSYAYYIDNDLASVSYANAVNFTPKANYGYDARYNRLTASEGQFGTTAYTYNPVTSPATLGATRLATVQSPLPNSAISYTYDELGRVTNRSINGVAETRAYDALGRITSVANPLGTFTYSYDGPTSRLLQVGYPNGQVTNYTYAGNTGDRRLTQIQNQKSGGTNISTFNYTYDAVGQISTWTQQADAASPKAYSFSYDAVGEVLGATLTDTSTSTVLKTYVYGYDDAGNRTAEQINGAITTSSYNNLNQLTGQVYSSTPSLKGPKPLGATAPKGGVKGPAQPKAHKASVSAPAASAKSEVAK